MIVPFPMLLRRLPLVVSVAVICHAPCFFAQGTQADYQRADGLRDLTRGKLAGLDFQATWSPDGKALLVKKEDAKGRTAYVRFDLRRPGEAPAFDHEKAALLINKQLGLQCDAGTLPVQSLAMTPKGALRLYVHGKGKTGIVTVAPDGGLSWAKDIKDAGDAGDADEPDALPALPPSGRRASRRTGREVHLLFANRMKKKVQLFWIDAGGGKKHYHTLAPGETHNQHTFEGHVWLVTDAAKTPLMMFVAGDRNQDAVIAASSLRDSRRPERKSGAAGARRTPPSGNREPWRPFLRDYNVFLRHETTREEVQLSTDGTEDRPYEGRFNWSPDGKKFMVNQTAKGQRHTVYTVESSPGSQRQPKLHEFNYRKPGDAIPQAWPRLFDAARKKQVPVKQDLFDNPWSVSRYHWSPDSKGFYFLYNQRGHQVLRLLRIDAESGAVKTIMEEAPGTFVDYNSKCYCRYLESTGEVIWMSERDGWNHLYLVALETGEIKHRITRGKWVVRAVDEVDEDKRQLLIRVMGYYPDQDPYHVHFARVGFDGRGFTMITRGNGTHALTWSPDRRHVLDRYSRVDCPPVVELRRCADGALLGEVARGDWSALKATGWRPPEPFSAKGRDGKTDIYGVIYRPATFDPQKKYPVIEAIYAGPHGQHVPKDFRPFHRQQALAELGFVVVQIDGMGTNWRSKAFHDVCWKNLGDAGFPDRKAWIKAAARKYPFMDIARVGIYGGSAGGQNAMRALIDHHDFYKVAVADCGCHDNRMDKIWWNELWMSWPIDKAAYDKSSNVVGAHRLCGHLLLTVGELDRNVDPASTLQVVDALIKADKDFELIVFPGRGHGAGGSRYGVRRMRDFFVRHLHGVEPRRAE